VLSFEPYAHPHGPMAWADDVWRLATLEIWLRSEADPGFCERAEEELPLSGTRHELVA
jgi:hypothetical protein